MGRWGGDHLDDRGAGLIVPLDRDAFASSNMLAVARSHDDNLRFGAAAARNAKHFLHRPDFLLCFDCKHSDGWRVTSDETQKTSNVQRPTSNAECQRSVGRTFRLRDRQQQAMRLPYNCEACWMKHRRGL